MDSTLRFERKPVRSIEEHLTVFQIILWYSRMDIQIIKIRIY